MPRLKILFLSSLILISILTILGLAKQTTKTEPIYEAELSPNAPINVVLIIFNGASTDHTIYDDGLYFSNTTALNANAKNNTQSILTRIPPGAEGTFREKSLLTLFDNAGYNTYYINAENGTEIAQSEAKKQIKGLLTPSLKKLLKSTQRKFIIAESNGETTKNQDETIKEVLALIKKSDKASLLLFTTNPYNGENDGQNCATEIKETMFIYANDSYLNDAQHKTILSRLANHQNSAINQGYIFETLASLGNINYSTANGLRDLTRINPSALVGKRQSICTI